MGELLDHGADSVDLDIQWSTGDLIEEGSGENGDCPIDHTHAESNESAISIAVSEGMQREDLEGGLAGPSTEHMNGALRHV